MGSPGTCVPPRRQRLFSQASAASSPSRPSAPSTLERACAGLLFLYPMYECYFRLHLLTMTFFSTQAINLVWYAKMLAATSASNNATLVQHYESLSKGASLLHADIQKLAAEANALLQPLPLDAASGWLKSQLHSLMASSNLPSSTLPSVFMPQLPAHAPASPISAALPGTTSSSILTGNGNNATGNARAAWAHSSSVAGQAFETMQEALLCIWDWCRDVVLRAPSVYDLWNFACLGLGLRVIMWSMNKCLEQGRPAEQPQIQEVGLLGRARTALNNACAIKRPEALLACALGSILLRISVVPLNSCTGGGSISEQLIHNLHVSSSVFLSLVTICVASGCMYTILTRPLPSKLPSPAPFQPSPRTSPPSRTGPRQHQQGTIKSPNAQLQHQTASGQSNTDPSMIFTYDPPSSHAAHTPKPSSNEAKSSDTCSCSDSDRPGPGSLNSSQRGSSKQSVSSEQNSCSDQNSNSIVHDVSQRSNTSSNNWSRHDASSAGRDGSSSNSHGGKDMSSSKARGNSDDEGNGCSTRGNSCATTSSVSVCSSSEGQCTRQDGNPNSSSCSQGNGSIYDSDAGSPGSCSSQGDGSTNNSNVRGPSSSDQGNSSSKRSHGSHPVFFLLPGLFSMPRMSSSLPATSKSCFREGTLNDILRAAESCATIGVACTSFFTIAALWFQGQNAPLASVLHKICAYVLYRGVVEGLMVEIKGLTDGEA